MKIILSFALAFLLISFSSMAQNGQPSSNQVSIKLDQNSLVKDEQGMEYPFVIWNKLLQGGKYGFKLADKTNPNAPIFLIYKLSEEEIEARNNRMAKPRESGSFADGDTFKPFNFRDSNNQKIKAEDLVGKVIVLNFWFINCPPCRQEIPDLNALVEKYKGKDVFFMALALDSWSDIDEFIKKTPFNYHIYPDARITANNFRVRSYPTHVVVDKSNKVVFQTTGLATNTIHWIQKSIDQALAE